MFWYYACAVIGAIIGVITNDYFATKQENESKMEIYRLKKKILIQKMKITP